MCSASTSSFLLLQHLHDLGGRIEAALDGGDLQQVQHLLHRRGDALARLHELPKPRPVPPAWNALATTIAQQQETLLHRLQELEHHLTDSLGTVTRYHRAQAGYARPRTERSILKEHVRG